MEGRRKTGLVGGLKESRASWRGRKAGLVGGLKESRLAGKKGCRKLKERNKRKKKKKNM